MTTKYSICTEYVTDAGNRSSGASMLLGMQRIAEEDETRRAYLDLRMDEWREESRRVRVKSHYPAAHPRVTVRVRPCSH